MNRSKAVPREELPRSGPRRPLSRERVLAAAIAHVDAGGLDGLSMRRLGQALGVEAMSLYNHVAGKDDLLGGMVDLVVGAFELPNPDGDWKAEVRMAAISAHEGLVRHPWAARLMLSIHTPVPARLRWMDALLGCLRQAGFPPRLTDHAYHALDSHITGYSLWQAQLQLDPAELPAMASALLRSLAPGELPFLVEHIQQHLDDAASDDDGSFAFGLDLLLDGLERARAG